MHGEEDALERRIVTVLFADLVGFTPLSEQLDAEDVAAIQDRYFALARETINRYDGQIEKFIGDAVMAVFGATRSRDDDVERAVRAGLALISGVQQLNAAIGLDEDTLRLRVGINTGEAVVAAAGGENAGRVIGDTVNTAARLQSAAPQGAVLIGESTALAVADIADLGDQIGLELKGKSEPTQARVVNGLRAEPSREQAMGALRAPTIGRERELANLRQALERTRYGAVERWLVVAPPGVGKSRLLREVAELAETAGTAIWRTRSRPGSLSPYEAVAGLFASALGNSNAEQTLNSALAAASVPSMRARVVADASLSLISPRAADVSAGEDRDGLFSAWLDGLDSLAGTRPQIWLVEDVHWAGGDVIGFLDAAAARPAAPGRLIVTTARPSLLDEHPEWAGDETSSAHIVRLEALGTTDSATLVSSLVGGALPNDLVERIVERSDGNCLFIEELLRTWISVGTLVAADSGGWRLAVPAEEVPMPQSVQQIYAAQIDDLPPDARHLVRRASVAGRRFAVTALEPLGAVGAGLEPLRRRELLIGPVADPLFGDAFAYRHALLRDAGYASLARAERARLHVRMARWLEHATGERVAEVADQIAAHYGAALDSAPALASSIDDGLDRTQVRALAADAYERAGQAALALSAHDAARQLLRSSIDLTSDDALVDLGRRWRLLGEATAFAADMTEGASAYERSIAFYREAIARSRDEASVSGLAQSAANLADVWHQQLRFADARGLADQLLQEFPDAQPAATARLLIARAIGDRGAHGPTPEAERDLVDAGRLAELTGDRRLKLLARTSLASHHAEIGQMDMSEWMGIGDEAMALNEPRIATESLITAGMQHIDDAPRTVGEALAKAHEISIAYGLTELDVWILYTEAEALFAGGEWDRALDRAMTAIDVAEKNEYLRVAVRCIHIAVPIAGARGDRNVLERAANWYRGLEGRFEFPDSPYARIVRPAQDLELADAGLWQEYVPSVESCAAGFATEPLGPSWSAALDRITRAWVKAGEAEGASRAVDGLEPFADTPLVSELGRGTYRLLRARVAEGMADEAAAISWANEALAHFRVSDAPWWKAKAIRLLERTGAADLMLIAEVEHIEQALGTRGPTL